MGNTKSDNSDDRKNVNTYMYKKDIVKYSRAMELAEYILC